MKMNTALHRQPKAFDYLKFWHKSSRIIVCFLKKGVCQHEKIEANPICNCDSNIAFIYYWWNAGTASSTAFRLVITNHSGYIGLRRCIDIRTSA